MKWRLLNLAAAAMFLLVTLVMALPASAASFIKMATHTDAVEMMGQTMPARHDTSSVWMSEGKSCSFAADGMRYLYDSADDVLYMIDPAKKRYAKMSMDFSELADEMEDEMGEEESAQAKSMAEAMMGDIEVSVTPTGETKKIGDWNTTKYVMNFNMAMANSKTELWATEDIKIDYDAFKSVANSKMMMMPGFEKLLAEWKKVKGLAVYSVTETTMMGTVARSAMEVLEFADKDAPAGTFDIPADYKLVEMMEMQMGMGH